MWQIAFRRCVYVMRAKLAQLAKILANTAREQVSVHMQHLCSQIYYRKLFYVFINVLCDFRLVYTDSTFTV